MRWFGRIIVALFVATAVLTAALVFAVATDAGTRWWVAQAAQRTPLSLEGASGNLLEGLRFESVTYADEGQTVEVHNLEVAVALWPLLELRALDIIRLVAKSVRSDRPPATRVATPRRGIS